ncbi:Ig-like domain-containing protein [Hymenobacter sp. ASUV-10]|uniref:Ig-like domain-containing protein n=1 Tax=Hymenobacter aranciens TaxID=3063996 RepID=A0ABT9BIA1_9BACT|nr:Ig-like domain-containing protein [Hymenobacter sp. ASUV-10]MDO7877403.1 Ig-like domain-containing protein [Hymenobacter sp. ASUV-10]
MKSPLLLWLLLLCTSSGWAQLPTSQSFETNETVNYTSNAFDLRATSNIQYFTITNTNPPVNPNNTSNASFGSNTDPIAIRTADNSAVYPGRFWIAEGVRGTSNTPSSYTRSAGVVTMNPVNASSYTNIVVTVALADPHGPGSLHINNGAATASTFSADDKIEIQYSTNGTDFTTIGRFIGNEATSTGDMEQDVNLNGSVSDETGPTLNYRMTDYIFSGPTGVVGSPASLTVRVVVDQGGGQELAFDNIRITGTASTVQPPTLSDAQTATINYNETDPATQITSSITATNPAGTTLSGATVTIGNGFVASEDELSFTPVTGITGTYANGTLTFSGVAPIADYVTVLKSVKYRNSNQTTAKGGNRSIQFVVQSGASSSSGVIRNVLVRAILAGATTIPYTEDFTTDGEGIRYGSNWFLGTGSTGTDFAFTRTNAATYKTGAVTFSNISNAYYWYGVNTNSTQNSERIGRLETRQVDATSYSALHFQVLLGAESGASARWQTSDYFKMYYRTGGSSGTWKLFGSFRGTATTTNGIGDLRQDRTEDLASLPAVPAGTATLSPALTNYDFTIPADANGQQVDFKLELSGDGIDAEFAFDNIRVTGTANTAPTINSQTRSVAENSANGTNVGAAITASDADGNTLTYAITAGNTGGAFAINSATGQLTVANSAALNFEATPAYSLTVQVTDNGIPAASASATVNVNVTNVNEAPGAVTDVNAAANTVAENAANGSTVGITASATDPEGTTLSYSLTNNAGGRFAINASTGVVTVANGALLDFETNTSHSITVQASDGSLTSSQSFTIAVTNVNEAPVASNNSFSVNQNSGATVLDVLANDSDPDAGTTLTVTAVTQPANGTVTLTGGVVRFTPAAGFAGTTTFTYTISDGSLTSTATVTMTVNDVTPPSVTITSSAGGNGSTTATTPVPFTVTFSESVTNFAQNDLNVTGGAISGFSGSGTTYTFSVTPAGSGSTITVNIAANQAQDAAGNGNTVATQFGITYQQPLVATSQSVTVQLDASGNGTLAASSVNNGSTGPGALTYTIQKIVYGRVAENNTLMLTTPSGANFTAIRFASYGTPTNDANGNYRLGSCDAANSEATAQNSFVGRSTGSMDASNTSATNNSPVLGDPCSGTPKALAVQAAYSNDAAALSYNCSEANKTQYVLLTVSNGTTTSTSVAQVTVNAPATATISSVSPSSALRGATVTVSGTNLSGATSLTVGGATATISSLTATGFTFVVPAAAASGSGTISLTAPCSQTITSAFTVQNPTITVGPASLPGGTQGVAYSQGLSASGGEAPYTYAITSGALPSGLSLTGSTIAGTPTTNGTFNFRVAATDNSAAPGPFSGFRDYTLVIGQATTAAPVVTTPANVTLTNDNTPTYSGTAPAGSTVTVYVDNTAIGTTTATAGGAFSLTQPVALADGTHVVNATAQTSGALVSPVSNTNGFTVDATRPTVSISSSASNPTSTSPIPFTVTFSESVSGFAVGDVTVSNGSISSISGAGTTYTFDVTPAGSGTVTVSVPANVVQDFATNFNTAATPVSLTYTQPQTATPVVLTPANGDRTNDNTPTYGGTAAAGSNIVLFVDGAFADTTFANAAGNWRKTAFVPLAEGSHTIYVTAQANGQSTSQPSNTNTFIVDTTAPTVTLTSTSGASGGTATTSPLSFTATFSESVTGFVAGDITVTNGTVTSGPTGSGTTYTLQVTPTTPGTATTVTVAGNSVQDAAGNGNSASVTYALTFQAPTITVSPASLPGGTQGTAYSQTLSATGGSGSYTYALTGSAPSGLTLSGSTLSGTPTASGTFNFTITATDNSAAPGPYSGSRSYSVTIAPAVVTSVIWNGSVSTDWFTAGNWSPNQVPTAAISATIPTAPSGNRFPVIAANAATAAANNVSIATGATLNMTANTLNVAGNVTNNGSFVPTGGTVALGGTTLSNLLGSSRVRFWNLTVGANTAQLSTSAGASVRRLLTLNGNLTTNGNDFVTESDANGTGMVYNNGGVISGNVTVQRYILPGSNAGAGYRHISPPVSNATVASLATGSFSPVVNPAYNTSATPGFVTPFPTVFGYDESRLGLVNDQDFFSKGYYSPAALSTPLTVGKALAANLAAQQAFSFTGPQNNGTYSQTLSRGPVRGNPDQSGWHLVGNPYPSPLNYSLVAAADRVNIEGAIYVYGSVDQYNGTFRSYVNGVGGDPLLALGQGFWVRVAAGQTSGSLTFRNSQRVTNYANPAYNRTSSTRPLVQLDLQGANHADPLYVYFEQGATAGMDSEFDAVKMPNTHGLNLSAVAGAAEMSINGLPLPTTNLTVPLQVRVPATGTYTLHAASIVNLPAGMVAYLRDLQTGAVQDLSQQPDYTFSLNAAYTGQRFELFFTPQRVTGVAPASLSAQVAVFPNPAHKAVFVELPATLSRSAVTVTLVDALGRSVLTQKLTGTSTQLSLEGVAAGVYAVRLQTAQGTVTKKLTVE